jgi:hypothetical protein
MRSLALVIVRAGGRGRAVQVVATTAVTSGLLLVALSILRLWTVDRDGYGTGERLLMAIADEGTRPGAVFAVLLLTLPVLLLLNQAVRLGSPDQQRRYAALAVAGATRSDLRRWAVLEVGGPAFAGAVLGIPVWWVLRQVLGEGLDERTGALVPTVVGPGVWSVVVVAAVTAYGAAVGRRAASRAAATVESGVTRPPRGWPVLLVAAGVVVLGGGIGVSVDSLAVVFAGLLLVLAGALLSASWAAQLSGKVASRRARSAQMLIAGRRLQTDPRPAGRAAAAVGAVGLTAGALGSFVGDVLSTRDDLGDVDEYLVPAVVVGVCALVAIGMIAASLAVHSVETTLERRREMAALVATGVPVSVVGRAQRLECLLLTLPLTVACSVAGAIGAVWLLSAASAAYLAGALAVAATSLVVASSAYAATGLVRPWLRAAVDPGNLRTE